jgi:peptidoglycan/LPS O-acetylase OafA/YrhL
MAAMLRFVRTGRTAWVLLAAAYFGSVVVYALGDRIWFSDLIVVAPTFIAGVLAWRCWQMGTERCIGPWWLPDVCALLIIVVPFVCHDLVFIASYLLLFVVLVLTLASWTDACSRIWRIAPLVFLGEVSYSLYMTHTLTQRLIHYLVPARTFAESGVPVKLGIVAIYGFFIAGAALGCYWLIERPARECFRKRLRRRSSQPEMTIPEPRSAIEIAVAPQGRRIEDQAKEPAAHDVA